MRYAATENFAKVPVATPSTISDNTNFVLEGSSAACTRDTNGGVHLTTDSNPDSLAFLTPASDSAFADTTWGIDNLLSFEATIKTASTLTDTEITVGISDAPTSVTDFSGIDDNHTDVFFTYQPSVSPNWILVANDGTEATAGVSHVVVTNIPVVADTAYSLGIKFTAELDCFFYIDSNQAYFNPVTVFQTDRSAAPFVGVRGNAKSVGVLGCTISQAV